jgi:hypothetical protein
VDVIMPEVVHAAGDRAAAKTRSDAYSQRKAQLERLRASGLVKVSDLAEVETRLAEANADQQAARAVLRGASLGTDEAVRLADNNGVTTLRSPLRGIVVEIRAALGEVRDASGPPLARIAGEAAGRIEARLSHPLRSGATFQFVDASGDTHQAELVSEAPVVDPRDGTTRAWFTLRHTTPLAGGASGSLRAVVVPNTALSQRDGRLHLVRRSAAGALEPVAVQLLVRSGADSLVRGALGAGDWILTKASLAAPTPAGR